MSSDATLSVVQSVVVRPSPVIAITEMIQMNETWSNPY